MFQNDVTLGGVYKALQKALRHAKIDTYDLDARMILEKRAERRWVDVITAPEEVLSSFVLDELQADVQRRTAGEPLSRIYGTREFWGMAFEISPDTLDPRPDTESLVRAVLDRYKDSPPKRILDLGTGSGCILLALLKEWPEAIGYGLDKSAGALETAQKNALLHGLDVRTTFMQSDWWSALGGQKFDCIVSNPPYIPNQDIESLSLEVKNHDPILALDGGFDGLDDYKKIISELKMHLNLGGRAFLEIGINQSCDVTRLVEKSLSRVVDIYPDIAGIPRVVEISCGDK